MGDITFGELFGTTEGIGTAVAIPAGNYDVVVEDARAHAEKNIIFLDLKVLTGPSAGSQVQVMLNFPTSTAKAGAAFHVRKKLNGFNIPADQATALGDALKTLMFSDTVNAAALAGIADVLRGQTVAADIGVQKGGPYDGSNQLDATKAADNPGMAAVNSPAVVAAAPAETVPF